MRQQQISRRAARRNDPGQDDSPPEPTDGRSAAHRADLVIATIDAALAAS